MKQIISLILSLVSICISIMVIFIFFFNATKISVVSLETYLAASFSLVGLLVVFVLAYQIFSTVDLKGQFEKFQNHMNNEFDKLEAKYATEFSKLEVQSNILTYKTNASMSSSDGGIYINSKDDFKGVNSFLEAVTWYLKLYEIEKSKKVFNEMIINAQNSFECIFDIAKNINDNHGVFYRNGAIVDSEKIERRILIGRELNFKIIESENYNTIKYFYEEVQQSMNKTFICVEKREKPTEDLLNLLNKVRNNLRLVRVNENC